MYIVDFLKKKFTTLNLASSIKQGNYPIEQTILSNSELNFTSLHFYINLKIGTVKNICLKACNESLLFR